jgi:hypothetical protein
MIVELNTGNEIAANVGAALEKRSNCTQCGSSRNVTCYRGDFPG